MDFLRCLVIGIENRTQNVNKQPQRISVTFSHFRMPVPSTAGAWATTGMAMGFLFVLITVLMASTWGCVVDMRARRGVTGTDHLSAPRAHSR